MIGIIDSGIGGRGIEKEIKKLLPEVKIEYLADRKNFPYGTKPVSVLHKILLNNIVTMQSKGAELIVLACNSATVSSVKYLRKKVPVPIIGVEPAIKPAAETTKTKKIAIFATPITSKSQAQNNLIKKYCADCKVYKISFNNLAMLIEDSQTQKATSRVAATWLKYKNLDIDTIVLGCTHYTLIKKEIQKIVGPKVKLIDSNPAVAMQAKKIYDGLK